MRLVSISQDTYVNPELIEYITRMEDGGAVIGVGGKTFTARFGFETMISLLQMTSHESGMSMQSPMPVRETNPQATDLAY